MIWSMPYRSMQYCKIREQSAGWLSLEIVRQHPFHEHMQGIDSMVPLTGFKVPNLDVSVRRGDQRSLPLVCFAGQMEWFFLQFGCLLFRRFTYRHSFDLGLSLKFDGRLEISPIFY